MNPQTREVHIDLIRDLRHRVLRAGLPLATLDRLSKFIESHSPAEAADQILARLDAGAVSPPMQRPC